MLMRSGWNIIATHIKLLSLCWGTSIQDKAVDVPVIPRVILPRIRSIIATLVLCFV